MGKIVGAFAMSHQLGAPDGVEEQSERVFQGMREIGRRVRALEPTLIVILTSDHLNNFSLATPAPFAVGTAAEFVPCGDMGLPRDPVPGHAAFAGGLLDFAVAREGPVLTAAESLQPDHGVMIPLGIVDPQREIPMVPAFVNSVFYPDPSPAECLRFGALIAEYVATRPADERVVLLAAGGLSHWVGMKREGTVVEEWDRAVLDAMVQGRGTDLSALENADILATAGNGGLEIGAWIALAGAVPGAPGECLFYEAIPAWATGMAGVELHPA
ncbi:protocatechuate 3,4-dioxygenase [Croceicoccus estronivorus]|uniref:DODA-type extradiol aromatic ring-opening family dioxygenase n=1 Tax=Croceicoccus estronivorus TaxID=1172626 RepID=UPI00082C9D14|nr:protocatechuate 3,4-dioxygenase [Croceicoccus estronivorus]OCC25547.1 protocatechuate 3,4-dioxygenase [Croceicoccus estronivorus]